MKSAGSVVVGSALLLFLLPGCSGLRRAPPGIIELTWDSVPDEDLAGYRVHYGRTSSNDCEDARNCEYDNDIDVGLRTEHRLANLDNCKKWFVAVKAYDKQGQSSPDFSNEVSGWPRPVISAVIPSSAGPGETLTIRIRGANFAEGSTVSFRGSKIKVEGPVDVESCYEITARIIVAADASEGWAPIEVERRSRVFGRGTRVFEVVAPSTPPTR